MACGGLCDCSEATFDRYYSDSDDSRNVLILPVPITVRDLFNFGSDSDPPTPPPEPPPKIASPPVVPPPVAWISEDEAEEMPETYVPPTSPLPPILFSSRFLDDEEGTTARARTRAATISPSPRKSKLTEREKVERERAQRRASIGLGDLENQTDRLRRRFDAEIARAVDLGIEEVLGQPIRFVSVENRGEDGFGMGSPVRLEMGSFTLYCIPTLVTDHRLTPGLLDDYGKFLVADEPLEMLKMPRFVERARIPQSLNIVECVRLALEDLVQKFNTPPILIENTSDFADFVCAPELETGPDVEPSLAELAKKCRDRLTSRRQIIPKDGNVTIGMDGRAGVGIDHMVSLFWALDRHLRLRTYSRVTTIRSFGLHVLDNGKFCLILIGFDEEAGSLILAPMSSKLYPKITPIKDSDLNFTRRASVAGPHPANGATGRTRSGGPIIIPVDETVNIKPGFNTPTFRSFIKHYPDGSICPYPSECLSLTHSESVELNTSALPFEPHELYLQTVLPTYDLTIIFGSEASRNEVLFWLLSWQHTRKKSKQILAEILEQASPND